MANPTVPSQPNLFIVGTDETSTPGQGEDLRNALMALQLASPATYQAFETAINDSSNLAIALNLAFENGLTGFKYEASGAGMYFDPSDDKIVITQAFINQLQSQGHASDFIAVLAACRA
jgi:hypothetical protein